MRLSNNAVFNAASPAPRFYSELKWWRCNWRTTAEIYMQLHELTAISTAIQPRKVWERYVDDACSILKRTHLEKYSHYISNLHQDIKFTIKEESNGKLAFLDTFWNAIMERFLCWYIGTLHTLTKYLHCSSHHQTSCKKSVAFSLFNGAYSIITNKDDLTKENARINRVL